MSRKKLLFFGTLAVLGILTITFAGHSLLSSYSGLFMD